MSRSPASLRRDLIIGAAVLLVLYVVFRNHDGAGDGSPTPGPTPTTATTAGGP